MKMDGWKTIVSFWDTFWELHLFSCKHLRFRGGVTSLVVWHFLGGRFQLQPRPTPRESRGPRNGGAGRIHHNRWWASEAILETSLVLTWMLGDWLIGWLFFLDRKLVQTIQRYIQIYASNKLSMSHSIEKGTWAFSNIEMLLLKCPGKK